MVKTWKRWGPGLRASCSLALRSRFDFLAVTGFSRWENSRLGEETQPERERVLVMCQSPRSSSILSSRQPPGHLNFSRLACSNSSPSGQKSRSNAPPISTEIPPLKDKFRLQSNTVHAFQREICRNNTFKLLLKTLLKELFANKGEILSCKSVKSCKNRKKTHERMTL